MILGFGVAGNIFPADLPWAVYYSDQAPVEAFYGFELLILDSSSHPPLQPLASRGTTLLGYLSLGEVAGHTPYFSEVKAEGLLLQENKNWRGSHLVDVRDSRWSKRVVEQLIPAILRQGFHGVFLDTLDDPPYLENTDPDKFRGMTAAAADLVKEIRFRYPHIKIALNRGYDLLPSVEPYIDVIMGESVYSDYDFEKKTYHLVPEDLYREQVHILRAAKERKPSLTILTLDYWNPSDRRKIAQIYRDQRANGFRPYVATIELNRIVREPDR